MKKLIFIIPISACMFACQQANNITIEGEIQQAENKIVYLEKLLVGNKELIDSVKLNKKGHFEFNIQSKDKNFYLIRLSSGEVITIIAKPKDKIKILTKANIMNTVYSVEGSEDSKLINSLVQQLNSTKKKISDIQNEVKNDGSSELTKQKYSKVIDNQRKFSIDFIMQNATSLASYMAIYQKIDKNTYTLNKNQDIKFVRIVASSMKALNPNSEYTKAILANLKSMNKSLADIQISNIIKQKGENHPNIILKDTEGKTKELNSLKGKFIILNFWASQNSKSRALNKDLKGLYKKYHTKGLDIYQVSIDTEKHLWLNAVKQDKLNWINVCDLKTGSSNAAQTFNIQTIPANYLINKKGEIVGKNLYGVALKEKIAELLK